MSFLFFVVVITINNVDVTGLLVAALASLGGLYEENEISDAISQIKVLEWDIWKMNEQKHEV